MKFETLAGKQRSRRSKVTMQTPAVVEGLEVRSLLTVVPLTGPINGAPPVILDATPTMTWANDSNATSYDLWITDAEQRTVELIEREIPQNNFTPINELNLGLTRVWVRSNYADGTSSEWSQPTLFVVQEKPTVIGPVNSMNSSSKKVTETKPTIKWTSPPGAIRFDIYLRNLTTESTKTISLKVTPELGNNPVLDAMGLPALDADGEIQRQGADGVSSYELPDELLMGSYRVFVQSIDDGGKYSGWSEPYEFEVAPQVETLRPAAPTFQSSRTVEVTISGTPTSGSYVISLTDANGKSSKTAPLPYNAKTTQVQAAVALLKGFESAKVTTTGSAPNFSHLISFPVDAGLVAGSVTGNLNQGTVTSRTISARKVFLEWKPVEGATHYEVLVSKVASSGALTGLYSATNLTTSYQIPDLLTEGDYVFWVRAKRRHQVTAISFTEPPTSGNYRIVLTTSGKDGITQQTAPISYNATAAQIKAAVVALKGFENADVITDASAPNVRQLLQIPQFAGAVKVDVVESITPGVLKFKTESKPEVVGLWSSRRDFSTFRDPVVLAPVGPRSSITGLPLTNSAGQPLVTDARPTIEWTAVDKAARYEIWINSNRDTKPLITRSSTVTYKFEKDIAPGKYDVWVRAALTTGVLTGWSKAYAFEATGGAPIITSPATNTTVTAIPNITWSAVPDAESYEIWFAWVNEDFDYIVEDGITSTTYSPANPLPSGSYRVWIRAIKADGSALPWSSEVNFSVAASDVEQTEISVPELLASLFATPESPERETAAARRETRFVKHEDSTTPDESLSISAGVASSNYQRPATPTIPTETDGLIEKLAEHCKTGEWWMPQGAES